MRRIARACFASWAMASDSACRSASSCGSPVRSATWIGCVASVGGYCPRSSRTSCVFSGIGVDGDDPVQLVVLVDEVDHEIARELRNRELGDRGERPLPVEARDEQLVGLGEEAELRLGPAAPRDVGHDRNSRDDRAVVVAHRRRADLEGARLVAVHELAPLADRHLALLDRALERPAGGCDRAPPVVGADDDGSAPDALELVVPHDDAVLGVGDGDPERQLRDHRLQLRERVLRAAVEADEVERERDAPRKLRDELEVLVPVPAGLGRRDREHAEPPVARLERDDDERARLHAHELLLARSRDLLQRPRHGGPVDRLAGAEDLDDGDAPVLRDVVDRVDLVEESRDARLDVGVCDADELRLVARDVDVAAVGDPRDDEPRHPAEQLLVVERPAQLLRRLEQEREACARPFGLAPRRGLLRDVARDVDDELDGAVLGEDGRRAEREPVLPAARARTDPDHCRALDAVERPRGRQVFGRDASPVGVEHVVQREALLR